jgi:hypothetical protein
VYNRYSMLEQLVREVRAVIHEEARESLATGWAELRRDDEVEPTLLLQPIKLSAAPLEVHFDSEELLLCTPGRHGMILEFFADDCDDMPAAVRALAAAVICGEYSERLKAGGVEVEAEWKGHEGPECRLHTVMKTPNPEKNDWRSVSYESY